MSLDTIHTKHKHYEQHFIHLDYIYRDIKTVAICLHRLFGAHSLIPPQYIICLIYPLCTFERKLSTIKPFDICTYCIS